MRLTQVAGQAAYDFERQPAWCDRVLHSKVSVARKSCLDHRGLLELPFVSTREVAEIPMCRGYCALGGFTQSDHRPVCAAGPSAQWASEGCIFFPEALLEALLLAMPQTVASPSERTATVLPSSGPELPDLLSDSVAEPTSNTSISPESSPAAWFQGGRGVSRECPAISALRLEEGFPEGTKVTCRFLLSSALWSSKDRIRA